MADTQRQRGGRVRMQDTAQQIRLHPVLLFWLKTDLRSDLRALNCLGENAPRLPWIHLVTHAFVIQPP